MARAPKLYQKLAGRRGGLGSQTSLWLASDHVLLLEGNLFTECYQRVYLRDVQGLFVRPSRESKWVTFISLGLVALFGGLMALGGDTVPVFGVFGVLAVIVLLYGLFLARTCHFHVVTAVQRREWPNVARYGKARKVMKRLAPLIREAQAGEGGLPVGMPPMPAADAVSMQA